MNLKQLAKELWNGSNDSSSAVSNKRNDIFSEVIGHEDPKRVMNMAVNSKQPTNVLLIGPPGTSKTMMLREIEKKFPEKSFFCVGASSTKAGMTDAIFNKRPKFLLIDEIETMPLKDQNILLNLLEGGRLVETKRTNMREIKLDVWVFATCNSTDGILGALYDRFIPVDIPKYSRAEFEDICIEMMRRNHVNAEVAREAINAVYTMMPNPRIRNVLQIGKLAKTPEDVQTIVRSMRK